jgi:flagellar hook-associated protein 3 FlgL
MTAETALFNLQRGRSRLDRLQEMIASGKTVNRPSDDPITTQNVLNLEAMYKEGEQLTNNIKKASQWTKVTEITLTGISEMLSNIRKVAGESMRGISDPIIRGNTSAQLQELRKQIIDLGNTQLGDQFIFGGFKVAAKPFDFTTGAFSGTSDSIEVEIDRSGGKVALNVDGGALLKGTGSYGSIDIIAEVDGLITAINTGDLVQLKARSANIDASASQISTALGDVGGRQLRLDSAEKMLTQNQNATQALIANLQNLDMIKAATELNNQKTAFEAALAATAKINQLSLLDYLR